MNENERFIVEYLLNNIRSYINILDTDFVDAYIEACKPTDVQFQVVGANTCRSLGRTLASMYRKGVLKRETCGVQAGIVGMPRWVYMYSLNS